nr:hypothetical protein Iba_chr05dCG13680 [Ipomoea batatas]
MAAVVEMSIAIPVKKAIEAEKRFIKRGQCLGRGRRFRMEKDPLQPLSAFFVFTIERRAENKNIS